MKLHLLRHAQTTANAGLCYGITDVPVPHAATRALAAIAADRFLDGQHAWSCSPLKRCAGVAEAIVERRPGLDIRKDPRLAEMDFGAWEGRPWAAIPRPELDAWTLDFADTPAGGTGETVRLFMQRVGAAFDDWRHGGRDAVWITHAGVLRAAWLLQVGGHCPAHAGQWPRRAIAFGECVTIDAAAAPVPQEVG